MLSDVRSLWSSLSNVASTLNDNINIAIEKFDHDSTGTRSDDTQEELDIYKKLLDDAQMHHVELSQTSRALIAEKDAEVKYWKKKSGFEEAVVFEDDQDMNYSRLAEENVALQETLIILGSQLRDSLRESTDAKVLAVKFSDSQIRYEAMKDDYRIFACEVEVQNKIKNDTIENLVADYSRLAAESEIRQNGETTR